MVDGGHPYGRYSRLHHDAGRPLSEMVSAEHWTRMSQMSQDTCIKILCADIEGKNARLMDEMNRRLNGSLSSNTPESEVTPW